MLQTTDNETLSIQATGNKKNQDVSASGGAGGSVGGGESIKNLSTIAKLAMSKKPNFAKANSGTDFLTLKAKETFIHLWKAFTEALILRHFDSEYHIWIEINAFGYAIGRVLNQMTSHHSDQLISNHVTYKNLNPISSKSEICQWHLVAFFSWKMISAVI